MSLYARSLFEPFLQIPDLPSSAPLNSLYLKLTLNSSSTAVFTAFAATTGWWETGRCAESASTTKTTAYLLGSILRSADPVDCLCLLSARRIYGWLLGRDDTHERVSPIRNDGLGAPQRTAALVSILSPGNECPPAPTRTASSRHISRETRHPHAQRQWLLSRQLPPNLFRSPQRNLSRASSTLF